MKVRAGKQGDMRTGDSKRGKGGRGGWQRRVAFIWSMKYFSGALEACTQALPPVQLGGCKAVAWLRQQHHRANRLGRASNRATWHGKYRIALPCLHTVP